MTSSSSSITITVKLFAAYQEAIGTEEQCLDIPLGTKAVEVCDLLVSQYPSLAKWKSQTRFGINLEFVDPQTPLQSGDELVLIPPVSGG